MNRERLAALLSEIEGYGFGTARGVPSRQEQLVHGEHVALVMALASDSPPPDNQVDVVSEVIRKEFYARGFNWTRKSFDELAVLAIEAMGQSLPVDEQSPASIFAEWTEEPGWLHSLRYSHQAARHAVERTAHDMEQRNLIRNFGRLVTRLVIAQSKEAVETMIPTPEEIVVEDDPNDVQVSLIVTGGRTPDIQITEIELSSRNGEKVPLQLSILSALLTRAGVENEANATFVLVNDERSSVSISKDGTVFVDEDRSYFDLSGPCARCIATAFSVFRGIRSQ